jgi:hypothetical protein
MPLRSGELAVVAMAASPWLYTGAAAIMAPDVTCPTTATMLRLATNHQQWRRLWIRSLVIALNQAKRAAAHTASRIDLRHREIDSLLVHSAERFFPRAGHPDVHGRRRA